jgi:Rieske Fe-S protein
VPAKLEGNNLVVPLIHFAHKSKKGTTYKNYVVVNNEQLKYPICVFRQSDGQYIALLMQCTHQGTELQAFGDRLQCPAHGSEFDREGQVTQGPADTALRQFPVTLENQQLLINLK